MARQPIFNVPSSTGAHLLRPHERPDFMVANPVRWQRAAWNPDSREVIGERQDSGVWKYYGWPALSTTTGPTRLGCPTKTPSTLSHHRPLPSTWMNDRGYFTTSM